MWSTILGFLGTATSGATGAGAKFWAVIFLVVTLTGSLGYLYWKHTSLIESVKKQEAEIQMLNSTIIEKEKQIIMVQYELEETKKAYEDIRKINIVLQDKELVYVKQLKQLEDKLNKAGRDIGFLANMKPDMMEKIINKAAKDRNRCFEVISGQPKLEGEKNEVCPHLFVK